MVLSQNSIDAFNSYRQLLLDKDIPITIVLFIAILRNQQKSGMLCHETLIKFKTNRQYSKSDGIHLGLGVT